MTPEQKAKFARIICRLQGSVERASLSYSDEDRDLDTAYLEYAIAKVERRIQQSKDEQYAFCDASIGLMNLRDEIESATDAGRDDN